MYLFIHCCFNKIREWRDFVLVVVSVLHQYRSFLSGCLNSWWREALRELSVLINCPRTEHNDPCQRRPLDPDSSALAPPPDVYINCIITARLLRPSLGLASSTPAVFASLQLALLRYWKSATKSRHLKTVTSVNLEQLRIPRTTWTGNPYASRLRKRSRGNGL